VSQKRQGKLEKCWSWKVMNIKSNKNCGMQLKQCWKNFVAIRDLMKKEQEFKRLNLLPGEKEEQIKSRVNKRKQ